MYIYINTVTQIYYILYFVQYNVDWTVYTFAIVYFEIHNNSTTHITPLSQYNNNNNNINTTQPRSATNEHHPTFHLRRYSSSKCKSIFGVHSIFSINKVAIVSCIASYNNNSFNTRK